ncbi:hypothetical protein BKA83DRAFT_4121132 [Pisolithus microcarpus]|nr:hypothetical protein BKA83DRAFT_4121132 [Pisolithus microcarpus]
MMHAALYIVHTGNTKARLSINDSRYIPKVHEEDSVEVVLGLVGNGIEEESLEHVDWSTIVNKEWRMRHNTRNRPRRLGKEVVHIRLMVTEISTSTTYQSHAACPPLHQSPPALKNGNYDGSASYDNSYTQEGVGREKSVYNVNYSCKVQWHYDVE